MWDDVGEAYCSPREERARGGRNDASMTSRLDGFVIGLKLFCPAMPASGQRISSRAEFADFS